jgi:hypothetical protein
MSPLIPSVVSWSIFSVSIIAEKTGKGKGDFPFPQDVLERNAYKSKSIYFLFLHFSNQYGMLQAIGWEFFTQARRQPMIKLKRKAEMMRPLWTLPV